MSEIRATNEMKRLLKDYFQGFFPKDGPAPRVAWCTSVGPAELLIAMGYKVYYPENHGAMLGATRQANEHMGAANALGYSPDICSYLTSDVGAFLNHQTPLTRAYGIPSIPKPDLLVYNTNQCREVQDWFSFYARHFKVPAFGVISPNMVDELETSQVDYCASQFKDLVAVLGKLTGTKMDQDKLAEAVELSRQASVLWGEFLDFGVRTPAPMTFFDGCIQMAPAVVLRGTPEAVAYYRLLNDEMRAHVAAGEGAVKKERVRLYWEGMPVWGKLRYFSETLGGMGASAVASTYCNSWVFDGFSPADPYRSLARAYTEIFINRSEAKKEEIMAAMLKKFGIDGVIYHDAKTCPHNSNSRFGMPQRLSAATGIPHLVMNGDLCDLRCFSEEQTTTSLEAFVEQLEENKH